MGRRRARGRSRCAGVGRRRTGAGSAPRRRPTMPTSSSSAAVRCLAASSWRCPASVSPSAICEPIVRRGLSDANGFWKTICTRACSRLPALRVQRRRAAPSSRTCPARGFTRPTAAFASELLPQPDSPTRPTTCPRSTRDARARRRRARPARRGRDRPPRGRAPRAALMTAGTGRRAGELAAVGDGQTSAGTSVCDCSVA